MEIFTQKFSLGGNSYKVAIKDNIDIAKFPTFAGSKSLKDSSPALENAEIIQNILNNGCQIIGKTTMHELAFGVTGINNWSGTPINPKYPDLIPGGSSSGSAVVVAQNIVDFSIGTDTGGSVRVPACCCGIFGLKPTFGRISRTGVIPKTSSLDVLGPFANNMPLLTKAMEIIDPTFSPILAPDNFTIALLKVDANRQIHETIKQFFTSLELAIPLEESQYLPKAYHAGMHIINKETWEAFHHLLPTGLVGDDVATRIQTAQKTSEEMVQSAEEIRILFTQEIDQLLEKYHVLALPTMPDFPTKVVDAKNTNALLNTTALVRPFNLSGHPAISIPLVSACGLPVGLQLVAKKGDDELLCAISSALTEK